MLRVSRNDQTDVCGWDLTLAYRPSYEQLQTNDLHKKGINSSTFRGRGGQSPNMDHPES